MNERPRQPRKRSRPKIEAEPNVIPPTEAHAGAPASSADPATRETAADKGETRESGARRGATTAEATRIPLPEPSAIHALRAGEHANPHAVLGAHPLRQGSDHGIVVRTMQHSASAVECILRDGTV